MQDLYITETFLLRTNLDVCNVGSNRVPRRKFGHKREKVIEERIKLQYMMRMLRFSSPTVTEVIYHTAAHVICMKI
jgi:hypothetical protein